MSTTDSVPRDVGDYRAAAGLARLPVPLAVPGCPDIPPRGPGLFRVLRRDGESVVTNVRRIAGAERAPGSSLVFAAAVLLGLLAAGLFVVSLAAQYRYVFAVKHQPLPSAIEAIGLDAGMAVFSLLALGLAMAGQSARIERALIVVCAVASAGQNYAAADVTSPRSVAAYVMPPLFLALVVNRVVAVVRRHVLGDAERSVWAAVGRGVAAMVKALALVLLYLLRLVLAPLSTPAGLRRLVLAAAPVPERKALPPPEAPAVEGPPRPPASCEVSGEGGACGHPMPCPDHPVQLAREPGESKKRHLARMYQIHPAYGDPVRAARAAGQLAPVADLSPGTARAYISAFLANGIANQFPEGFPHVNGSAS